MRKRTHSHIVGLLGPDLRILIELRLGRSGLRGSVGGFAIVFTKLSGAFEFAGWELVSLDCRQVSKQYLSQGVQGILHADLRSGSNVNPRLWV